MISRRRGVLRRPGLDVAGERGGGWALAGFGGRARGAGVAGVPARDWLRVPRVAPRSVCVLVWDGPGRGGLGSGSHERGAARRRRTGAVEHGSGGVASSQRQRAQDDG